MDVHLHTQINDVIEAFGLKYISTLHVGAPSEPPLHFLTSSKACRQGSIDSRQGSWEPCSKPFTVIAPLSRRAKAKPGVSGESTTMGGARCGCAPWVDTTST